MNTPTEVLALVNSLVSDPIQMMDAGAFLDYAQALSWDVDGWLETEIESHPAALIVIIPEVTAGTQISSSKFRHGTANQKHAVRHHITYSLQPIGYNSGFKAYAQDPASASEWQIMAYFP